MDEHHRAPTLTVWMGPRQEHRIDPAQLLLSELLSLPAAALEARVAAELDANPALELPAAPCCLRCGRPLWTGTCPVCHLEGPSRDRTWPAELRTHVAAPVTARQQLLIEAARGLRAADRPVAAYLLEEVDHLGLLQESAAEVAGRIGVDTAVVLRVLRVLRDGGAPGFGAATIGERLRLEVAALGRLERVPPGVAALVERGFDHVGDGGDEERVALTWLRSRIEVDLFPREEVTAPVPVDLVVRRSDAGGLLVDVVPGWWSGMRVAESYCLALGDPTVEGEVARARRFLDGLARRAQTLARVAEVVVARQHRRMIEGPRAHRPLLRRDVAAALAVHESTVSRAVTGKYVLLPRGETVPFGALFGAARGVQECLRELIAAETAPLSDGDLACALSTQGYRIARRTVAKYRTVLGIPAQRER